MNPTLILGLPMYSSSLCRSARSLSARPRAAGLGVVAALSLLASLTCAHAATPAIVGGNVSSFVLRADGTVWAVGGNESAQLGNGASTDLTKPVKVMADVAAVSSGSAHTVFLKTDGTVWAVGKNQFGQLGDGTTIDRTTPVQSIGLTGITAIAAGGHHTLYLKSDKTAWAAGYTGSKITPIRSTPAQVLTATTAIAAGGGYWPRTGEDLGGHSLFLRTDGSVYASGDNEQGQLADGSSISDSRSVIVQCAGLTAIKSIAAGVNHSLFLKTDGSLWVCGSNEFGQLGINDVAADGTRHYYYYPAKVNNSNYTAIAAGGFHSLFLTSAGGVSASGLNDSGQLGSATPVERFVASAVTTNATGIAAGYGHSVILKSTGAIMATGANSRGQLGIGTTTTATALTQMGTIAAAAQTITFTSPGNQTMAATEVNLTGTSSAGLALTYTVTSGPATVSGSTLTLTGTGSVTVKASQDGTWDYAAATAVSRTFSVAKGAQTIAFTLPAELAISSTPLALTATSSSGLGVTYSVVSGPATITGTSLTLTGTGAVTLRASQAGNASFNAATDVDVTFTATPAVLTGLQSWAAAAGLTGDNALPDAAPFHDGVSNLLKYAFNMNGAAADVSVMASAGVSGLPLVAVDRSGTDPVLRVSFLRRKGSTLVYTAQRSASLENFVPMVGVPAVTSVDDTWERVTVEEILNLSSANSAFARVQVDMP